ncbi:MAG TPA: ABC transporter substrate-binding protein [Mobilitalea sp.]|nr:ABC transporter substrate-binding protein [Mobilitalea sp.]
MKKVYLLFLLLLGVVLLQGCSKGQPSPPSEEHIMEDIPSAFTQITVDNELIRLNIKDVELEEWQTDGNQDIAYCYVTMENNPYRYVAYCKLIYNYSKDNGWVLEDYKIYNTSTAITLIGDAKQADADDMMEVRLPDYAYGLIDSDIDKENCISTYTYSVAGFSAAMESSGVVTVKYELVKDSKGIYYWNEILDNSGVVNTLKNTEGWGALGGGEVDEEGIGNDPDVEVINVWSFTDEVPNIIANYMALNPGFPYYIKYTIGATMEGDYQAALDLALASGGADAPDIFCVESAYALKYTQGDASYYAAAYEDLGIDVDALVNKADIAQYTIDIGTNQEGDLVGLGYQATGGSFIYRRSIAKDVWGTDDPSIIKDKVGPGWDKFFLAAAELKAKGYGIVSGDGDIWPAVENSAEKGWVVNGKLYIDPKREEFLDISKYFMDNDYHNATLKWQDAWFADMQDAGPKQIFGFLGPSWLVNYVIAPNSEGMIAGEGTSGDWAICEPPVGFFWGGSWLLANKDTKVPAAVGELLEWITLDSSETGLQYLWANGTFPGLGGIKDSVASGTVMMNSDGSVPFLGEQNMYDVIYPANQLAKGTNTTIYDTTINTFWLEQVEEYSSGNKTRELAILDFKQNVSDYLDIIVE